MIHWLLSPTARHAALSRAQCTASLADHSKVYTSTVALVPPEEAWLAIQQARESLRDKGLYRWPPHINLLYPFVPEEHFAQAADALAPAAERCESAINATASAPASTTFRVDLCITWPGTVKSLILIEKPLVVPK